MRLDSVLPDTAPRLGDRQSAPSTISNQLGSSAGSPSDERPNRARTQYFPPGPEGPSVGDTPQLEKTASVTVITSRIRTSTRTAGTLATRRVSAASGFVAIGNLAAHHSTEESSSLGF